MKRLIILTLSLLSLLQAQTFSARAGDPNDESASAQIINEMRHKLLTERANGNHWEYLAHMGPQMISMDYLLYRWLGKDIEPQLSPSRLKSLLLPYQLPDGSWHATHDPSLKSGNLNATILNYWALKASGYPAESAELLRARAFILSRGGLERASMLTRFLLCLFRNLSWKQIPPLFYELFHDQFPIHDRQLGAYIAPTLMPLTYLQHLKLSKDLGPRFDLSELRLHPGSRGAILESQPLHDFAKSDEDHVRRIVSRQSPTGSWGGYSISTLLATIVLDDFRARIDTRDPRKRSPSLSELRLSLDGAIDRALAYQFTNHFESGESSYLGVLDGRYWDASLIGIALLDAGASLEDLRPTAEYLLATQHASGGFSFGKGAEEQPDVDCTAEAILFLNRFGSAYKTQIARAVRWMISMQNDDGGWGAYRKNNAGNVIFEIATRPFRDSTEFFDPSCADIVGHALEALGEVGHTIHNSQTVQRAVSYLRETQDRDGKWSGRWGVNYLYGTSTAVVGLMRVGFSPSDPMVARAVKWMISKQNRDGGFGESTLSYEDERWAGIGVSTPTQTAWVMLALQARRDQASIAEARAARYLETEYLREGRWKDGSVVGTGHRKIVYIEYPSYPRAFPLSALARRLGR